MSDYPRLISNKLHSFRNFIRQNYMFSTIKQILTNLNIELISLYYFIHMKRFFHRFMIIFVKYSDCRITCTIILYRHSCKSISTFT